jgi:hypothetical protein
MREMRSRTAVVLIVLLAFVLAMAIVPAALAKSQPVAASGSWTWVNPVWGERDHPNGSVHLYGVEIGQWTGTFTASDTYEPYVAGVTKSGELWAKLWIHFTDATVDMGGGVLLHGDMTLLVSFHAGIDTAKWKIENGTGGLQHLGGAGTLVSTDTGMDYSGMIWSQK